MYINVPQCDCICLHLSLPLCLVLPLSLSLSFSFTSLTSLSVCLSVSPLCSSLTHLSDSSAVSHTVSLSPPLILTLSLYLCLSSSPVCPLFYLCVFVCVFAFVFKTLKVDFYFLFLLPAPPHDFVCHAPVQLPRLSFKDVALFSRLSSHLSRLGSFVYY